MTYKKERNQAKEFYFHRGNPLTDPHHLIDELHKHSHKYPLIAERGNGLEPWGVLNQTGVVVVNQDGAIVASIKHPRHTPVEISAGVGKVTYGGPAQIEHIEKSLEVPTSPQDVQTTANLVLLALNSFGELSKTSRQFSGLGAVGSEPEAWAIDPQTGHLQKISAGELQEGLVEETLSAITIPQDFILARSNQILERKKRYGDAVIVDTSTLMTSSPTEITINIGHDKGPYVTAIQQRLMEDFFNFADPEAEQVMDQIAQAHGFENHKELKDFTGNMAYWAMAASHGSVGLPHMRFSNAAHATSEMEAIAVGDIFNTNLATVAEMLMFSSPMLFGVSPTVKDSHGKEWHPRDVRAIARYVMDTTNPGDFIRTPQEMRRRIIFAIQEGLTHTMDRASYLAQMPNGKIVPCAHGRVRNRIASPEPSNQSGRIEFTGCSASFSILDEMARNCFLQVLTIAAYEALSVGQHPVDYFAKNYPSLGDWTRQKDLAKKASLQGFHESEVESIIQEAIRFMKDMRKKFSALTVETSYAQARLENLLLPPAQNLDEYLNNPRGPVSEVLQKEIEKGIDPLSLVKKIETYELALSQKILEGSFTLPTYQQIQSLETSGQMASLFVLS